MKTFASDNAAGAHPEILDAIARANRGHALAYGHDEYTEAAGARFRDLFGERARVLFVFGGTGANVVALGPALRPYHSVLCAASSHLWMDECGAVERILGAKLVPIPTPDGKLDPDSVRPHVVGRGVVHHAQPRVLSVTQSTEWGTRYRPEELAALADFAHGEGMVLHVDGARLANAAAALDLPLAAFTTEVGVDVLSFGGTKNGLLFGDAVVFLDPTLAAEGPWFQKQGTQLPSKMRFVAAQFDALLSGDLWLRSARHANAMARRLADALASVEGVEIVQPVEVNAVFCRIPAGPRAELRRRWTFHDWDEATDVCRLMTAFDTTEEDVDGLAADARALLGISSGP